MFCIKNRRCFLRNVYGSTITVYNLSTLLYMLFANTVTNRVQNHFSTAYNYQDFCSSDEYEKNKYYIFY